MTLDDRSSAGLSSILLGLVHFNAGTAVGKTACLVSERLARSAVPKSRSSGLIPARRADKPRVLERRQIRQVAQRLEPGYAKKGAK